MFDIHNMPAEDISAYYALNMLNPFTYDAQSERDGLLITEIFNQRRKKQIKSWEMFSYLKPGTPEWLSDPTVKTARTMLDNIMNVSTITKKPPNFDNVYRLIREEIDIEINKPKTDLLKLKELRAMLPKS